MNNHWSCTILVGSGKIKIMVHFKEQFDNILKYTVEQLRKQEANMVYENGYGVKAVPKSVIESIPRLILYDQWEEQYLLDMSK